MSCSRIAAALLGVALLAAPGSAHAWSYQPFSLLVSVEAGPRFNLLRLREGTRQTPAGGMEAGLGAELVLWAPWWMPHRLSLVGAVRPDFQGSWDLPVSGRHPSRAVPLPNPGILKWPALGVGASAGLRYRFETGSAFVPFFDVDVLLRGHKTFNRSPLHINLALRGGGGIEYYVLHRVGFFAAFHVQSGPMLWPLPYVVPYPEASTEFLFGSRFRIL